MVRTLLALVLSIALHLALLAPYVLVRLTDPAPETPGDRPEATDDAPVGDGGDPSGVEALKVPPRPVAVSIYQAPVEGADAGSTAASDNGLGYKLGSGPHSAGVSRPEPVRKGVSGKPPRGRRSRCDPFEEVVPLGSGSWSVERSILDYYATHMKELDKQGGVAVHRDEAGKKDGALLYVPRCSVLRDGGMKNHDVLHRVNGRKVQSMTQAITTWLSIRNASVVTVEFTRDGQPRTHTYQIR